MDLIVILFVLYVTQSSFSNYAEVDSATGWRGKGTVKHDVHVTYDDI